MVNTNCCKDCQKRFFGCHSQCDDYKAMKEELNRINNLKRTEHDLRAVIERHGANKTRRYY